MYFNWSLGERVIDKAYIEALWAYPHVDLICVFFVSISNQESKFKKFPSNTKLNKRHFDSVENETATALRLWKQTIECQSI